MEDSTSSTKDPSRFLDTCRSLLGYVTDGKSPKTTTHINTTYQALFQKNFTYNQQGPRQCDGTKQTSQKTVVSDKTRDPAQGENTHRRWLAAGVIVGTGACLVVLHKTGILPVLDYFRGSNSSEAQACADSPGNIENCNGSSDKKASAGSPDNKACEPDNKDAEGDQSEDTPQHQGNYSDTSVYKKHQFYAHRSLKRCTAEGQTVTEETTHVITTVKTVNQRRPHEAQPPKQASPATGRDDTSQQAERQALSRSIMDRINVGGQQQAGV